jgi:hypothetical protein
MGLIPSKAGRFIFRIRVARKPQFSNKFIEANIPFRAIYSIVWKPWFLKQIPRTRKTGPVFSQSNREALWM